MPSRGQDGKAPCRSDRRAEVQVSGEAIHEQNVHDVKRMQRQRDPHDPTSPAPRNKVRANSR